MVADSCYLPLGSTRSRGEWDKLAKWVVNNKLFSDNVRWLIQIPRLYEVFKASGTVESFGDVVTSEWYALCPDVAVSPRWSMTLSLISTKDIFQPLFEVTKDPRTHPELHVFLQRVIGFDSVDDESKSERRLYRSEWSIAACFVILCSRSSRLLLEYPFPKDWNTKQNPPYNYWLLWVYP